MTPNWNDAPEWAEWVAMDDDGVWFWYEAKPALGDGFWLPGYAKLCRRVPTQPVTPICHPRPTTETEL